MNIVDGYQAVVGSHFELDGFQVILAQTTNQGTDHRRVITRLQSGSTPEWVDLPAYAISPSLIVPRGFAVPLRDALDEYLGRPHDDFRGRYEEAREALAHERNRVDNVLLRP